MLPLYEMFANAQNGRAMEEMARQFGLSSKQVEDALAALMPAFSTGLKRNTANPADLGAFLQALASGRHVQYFEDMTKAFTPSGRDEGNGILDHLFGSKEVSRAIADQAARATGIGQEIYKQMLPAIAAAMMGGLYKQSTGQMGAGARQDPQDNPLTAMMNLMTRQQSEWAEFFTPRQKASTPPPADNPFMKAMEQMMGKSGEAGTSSQAGFDPLEAMTKGNPFGQAFRDMLEGGFGQVHQPGAAPPEEKLHPEPEPEPETEEEPRAATRSPYEELFGEMFETGRKTQAEYQRQMESIFDEYMKGSRRDG